MTALRGSPATARRTRRARRYSTRDVVVLVIGLGIAVLVDLAVVWGPTLASVALSGTDWNGISKLRWIGGDNYRDLTTEYPPFWTAVRNNVLWLGFIAQLVYSQDYGVLNAVTGMNTDWLGDPSINIWVVMVAAAWRHVGYVMIIYLAGLKAVDPALKEAAAIDGANERQAFFRVVFPVLRPINVIVLVITVIEALRAFDIVYAINKGRNGLELLSVLVTENIVGETSRIGFGSAIAVVLLVISMGFIVTYLTQVFKEER
ncbi:carbohydrate ABC transporter permease [Planobispora takensis]|uniref:ABC transporter permease n=1 Tax=Planobispora takensis TaxID=1367882 RepID=A0A8J3SY93_9ACTN|nr:sugar ABC transporter permease [Planobispora takensis]GII01956.1 ABC transporter permease [Planobispora takensis]